MAEVPNFGKLTYELNNGQRLPAVGIGTYKVKTYEDMHVLVDNALATGYKLFDTASVYKNEAYLGQALRELLPKYELEREDIFVTTKLSINCAAPAEHGTELVPEALKKSLELLSMDYVDMYMIHFPGIPKIPSTSPKNKILRIETWKAMEKLYDEGKVNSIGVCNFTEAHLLGILSKHTNVPVVNQVEFHPYYPQRDLLSYCNSQFINLQAYCSFGGASSGCNELMENPVVQAVAAEHDATPAQVLLVWALQQGVAVIPKSTKPEHIRDNFKLNFRLTPGNMRALDSFDVIRKYTWNPEGVV